MFIVTAWAVSIPLMFVGVQIHEIFRVMSEKSFVFEDYIGHPNGQPGFFRVVTSSQVPLVLSVFLFLLALFYFLLFSTVLLL